MNLLAPLMSRLEPGELAALRQMLKENVRLSREKRLLDLLIAGQKSPAEMMMDLFGSENRKGFEKLRSRLITRIEGILSSRLLSEELSPDASARQSLAIARDLITAHEQDAALFYWNTALRHAENIRRYDLILMIVRFGLEHFRVLKLDPDQLSSRLQRLQKSLMIEHELIILHAHMEARMLQARLSGQVPDVDELLALLQGINLEREEANDPAILFQLASIVRRMVIPSKHYLRLKPFLQRLYGRLEIHGVWKPTDTDLRARFLFLIAHMLFRIREFEDAEKRLDELESLFPPPSFRSHVLFERVVSLRAVLYSYTYRVPEAVALLSTTLYGDKPLRDAEERCNMQLNLAVAWFHQREYRKANQVLLDIRHSRRWLLERKGREWIYKKEMIEVIVLYEIGHDDLARNRLIAMQRSYKAFLDQAIYRRALVFMSFIQQMIDDRHIVSTPAFREEVKKASLGWGAMEDIQAITFFSWLVSKIKNREYYEVLMEQLRMDSVFPAPAP